MGRVDALAPLLAALRSLIRWLRATRRRGVIVGGVAASLLGRPRLTADVDAVVLLEEDEWAPFVEAGADFDIVPRRADALAFARRARVLLRHEPSGIPLDVSLGALPFEKEMIARARLRRLGSLGIPLPRPEDLVIMKAVAHRPRDAADIEAIIATNPRIDVRRVRAVVREFAAVLEAPELSADLDRLLAARRAALPRRRGLAKAPRRRPRPRPG